MAANNDTERRALAPGREVPLKDLGITATVYPVGFTQIRRFGATFGKAAGVLSRHPDADQAQLFSIVFATMTDEVLDLVAACVKLSNTDVTMDDLAHWHVAEIAEAWWEESFGDPNRFSVWTNLIQRMGQTFTRDPKFSIKGMFSKLSSPPDTLSKKS